MPIWHVGASCLLVTAQSVLSGGPELGHAGYGWSYPPAIPVQGAMGDLELLGTVVSALPARDA